MMWLAVDGSSLNNLNLPKIVLAIGSLGTAAYGVVDATKGFNGGVSNRGFGDIQQIISKFIPAPGDKEPSALALPSVLATLHSNWINGVPLAHQKSIAKSLIKLNLNTDTANEMAAVTGVKAEVLSSIAAKLATGEVLTTEENDVYGRFDLLLNAQLDQAYQRADQRYRNSAKLLSFPVAVLLALLGVATVDGASLATFAGWKEFLTSSDIWKALFAGLLATPLAPVAKDLSTAIQAGAKVAQSWKK